MGNNNIGVLSEKGVRDKWEQQQLDDKIGSWMRGRKPIQSL